MQRAPHHDNNPDLADVDKDATRPALTEAEAAALRLQEPSDGGNASGSPHGPGPAASQGPAGQGRAQPQLQLQLPAPALAGPGAAAPSTGSVPLPCPGLDDGSPSPPLSPREEDDEADDEADGHGPAADPDGVASAMDVDVDLRMDRGGGGYFPRKVVARSRSAAFQSIDEHGTEPAGAGAEAELSSVHRVRIHLDEEDDAHAADEKEELKRADSAGAQGLGHGRGPAAIQMQRLQGGRAVGVPDMRETSRASRREVSRSGRASQSRSSRRETETTKRRASQGDKADGTAAAPPLASSHGAASPSAQEGQGHGHADGGSGSGVWLRPVSALGEAVGIDYLDLAAPNKSAGLSAEEAAARLARDGPNELSPPKERPEWVKFLMNFLDPFMILLQIAGLLSMAVAYPVNTSDPINLYLGIILYFIVIVSCAFSYLQEGKATSAMKAFQTMLPQQAHVVRGGVLTDIPAAQLVVGDLVQVRGGDVIPADLRAVWTQSCSMELSSITGESVPIMVTLHSHADKMEQATNVLFNTAKVLEGDAFGVVIATGDRTIIGQVAGIVAGTELLETTLQREIRVFVKRLTVLAVSLGLVFFAVGMARGETWIFSFINGFVVVLVACIPQGLSMTVISCLSISAKRLAALNVFVKRLQCVETLGSCSVIATDKTGTLTQNKMTVSHVWLDQYPATSATIMRDMPPQKRQQLVSPKSPRRGSESLAAPGAVGSVRGLARQNSMSQRATSSSGSRSGASARHSTLHELELIMALCSRTRFEDERVLSSAEAAAIEDQELLRTLDPTLDMDTARRTFPKLFQSIDPSLSVTSASKSLLMATAGRTADGQKIADDSERKVSGDASETALFNFLRQRHHIELLRYYNPIVFDVPFNSRHKYALTIVRRRPLVGAHAEAFPEAAAAAVGDEDARTLLMKGAPEIIVARCTHWMCRGMPTPIDDEFRENFQSAYESFGNLGERVLGFASLQLPASDYPPSMDSQYSAQAQNYPTHGLCFVALVSLIDPPKDTVPAAVADCRSAGVKVVMVTGDHALTAAAIARQVGILSHPTLEDLARDAGCSVADVSAERRAEVQAAVVTGAELDRFTPNDWERVCAMKELVFARTTPVQKLQIVQAFQARGEVVAATGDGVNDSPALKAADLGVAMGISGSDVARGAADLILMDDDFASICVGIREGRAIFDNLGKCIVYTLSHLPAEVFPVLFNLALGFPLALSAIQILIIDLGTEMAPGVSVAYEPSEGNVMSRPPRDAKKERLVNVQMAFYCIVQVGLVQAFNCFLAFFLVFHHYGIGIRDLFDSKSHFQPGADNDPILWSDGTVRYDSDEQLEILCRAQTAYWVMLVTAQMAHLFMTKTKVMSVFRYPLFANPLTVWALAIELCLLLLIVLPPSSHLIFGTNTFPPIYALLVLLAPALLLVITETQKAVLRARPNGFVAKYIKY